MTVVPIQPMIQAWHQPVHHRSHSPHLIMCPFAGGSRSAFRQWLETPMHRSDIAVSLVTYPGRDHLRHARPLETIDALAMQLADELCAAVSIDHHGWVLGGHSMGAQVAFETCRLLEARGRAPRGLVLSGCHAPHLSSRRRLSHLNDTDFIQALIDIGGCDPQLLAEPALMALFMPLLRADFQATETYERRLDDGQFQLKTPCLLMFGRQDQEAFREEVAAWQHWLLDAPQPIGISGDHFYPIHRPRAFFQHILNHFESHNGFIQAVP